MNLTDRLLELEDMIGRDSLEKLIGEYGGRNVYIPRAKKHDPRIPYLKTIQYMQGYLEEGQTLEEIAAENLLTEYQQSILKRLSRFCESRYIHTLNGLLYALNIVSGKESEKLLLTVGAAALANLMEYYGGKSLFIPPYYNNESI